MQINDRVGDYEILGELGSGGMGRVYRVRNVLSERIEAMKVLLPDLAGRQDLAARFMREIKVLATLTHPNIAALRTALTANNQLVMIMELVEGQPLSERLNYGAIPMTDALSYIDQVLDALAYAHSQNVVHRDLKPANMMLTPQGVVKLTDFGIARGRNDETITVAGTTTGSLSYMSPEQVSGSATDARSDIYSMGISLYEMVTGQRPFQSDSDFAIMNAHLKELPRPPIELQPSLGPALNSAIMKAIAKDPADRYQSADEFRQALKTVPGTAASGTGSRAATVLIAPGSVPPGAQSVTMTAAPGSRPAIAPAPSDHARTVLDTRPPSTPRIDSVQPGGRPAPVVPPPPPAKHPMLYVAIGGALAIVALAGTGFYLRNAEGGSTTSGSSSTPSRLASDVPAKPTATPAAPPTAAGVTRRATTGGIEHSRSCLVCLGGAAGAGTVRCPAADRRANPGLPPRPQPQGVQPPAQAEAGLPPTGKPQVDARTAGPLPQSAAARLDAPVRTVRYNRCRTAEKPAGRRPEPPIPDPPGSPQPADQAPPRATAQDAAALDEIEQDIVQMTARVAAVNGSLDRMQDQQARQGLGMRGDIVARQQSMNLNMKRAQQAIDEHDAARARRYRDTTQADLEALEKFLGR